METLALGYTLPTTRACYGLSPIRLRPYWAHIKNPIPDFPDTGFLILIFYFRAGIYTGPCLDTLTIREEAAAPIASSLATVPSIVDWASSSVFSSSFKVMQCSLYCGMNLLD